VSGSDNDNAKRGAGPAEIMRAAEAEGFNGRNLAIALMDCAQTDGGT